MSIVIPEEKLREMVRTEQRKHEESGGLYKRHMIPLGFFAVGEDGEDVDVAQIMIEQLEIVNKIIEE